MAREIRLNAFDMNCVGHIQHGMWTHPRDRSSDYTDITYWTELARTLEPGLFDGIFLADVVGVYDVYEGSPDAALRNAAQVPVNDPMLLIPAMAVATQHLGCGVTCNTTYEPPYLFARRMSRLDHLTRGRIGWKDGAMLRDRARGVFSDPARVHSVRQESGAYRMNAIRTVMPECIVDFVDLVVPVLQERGAHKRAYAPGTLREKLFGTGRAQLPASHPAARVRAREPA